jgi:hypothetical protein
MFFKCFINLLEKIYIFNKNLIIPHRYLVKESSLFYFLQYFFGFFEVFLMQLADVLEIVTDLI